MSTSLKNAWPDLLCPVLNNSTKKLQLFSSSKKSITMCDESGGLYKVFFKYY